MEPVGHSLTIYPIKIQFVTQLSNEPTLANNQSISMEPVGDSLAKKKNQFQYWFDHSNVNGWNSINIYYRAIYVSYKQSWRWLRLKKAEEDHLPPPPLLSLPPSLFTQLRKMIGSFSRRQRVKIGHCLYANEQEQQQQRRRRPPG